MQYMETQPWGKITVCTIIEEKNRMRGKTSGDDLIEDIKLVKYTRKTHFISEASISHLLFLFMISIIS